MFNCVMWAIKHELPNIFDIGLDILLTILQVFFLNLEFKLKNEYCK